MKKNLDFYKQLGARIRTEREKRDLTLDELISWANLSCKKSTLSEIETGKQKILPNQLLSISKFLVIKVDDLLKDLPVEIKPHICNCIFCKIDKK